MFVCIAKLCRTSAMSLIAFINLKVKDVPIKRFQMIKRESVSIKGTLRLISEKQQQFVEYLIF